VNTIKRLTTSSTMFTQLPALGVGLGFRPPFRGDLFLNRDRVDFLEITADHYLESTPEKARELALLAEHFVLIPHGLSLSLGSAEGLDPEYRDQLLALVRAVKPPWWSEHIAFTRAGGIDVGHLCPVPFSREALDVVSSNITEVQDRIEVPLILENITYTVQMPGANMAEAEFLAELVDRTGCGLLLDVTNLHTNAVNLGYDPIAFLDRLPMERVVQLHFAGGQWENGMLVDSHARPAPPEVWALLDEVLARAPVRGIILERDEDLPPFGALLDELDQARELGRRHRRWA
jgi:uncharacterized protein (UPF0276 family)